MSCEYSKYINKLMDGSLDKKKIDELKNHSAKCEECTQRIDKLSRIDNLIKDSLIPYSYSSSKSEIMKKIETKKKQTLLWANLYRYRKPIYAFVSVLIIALSLTYIKIAINSLVSSVQSASESRLDENDLKFPINSENIKSIYMPGEDYKFDNSLNWIPHMPMMKANDPESEATAKRILDEAAEGRAKYLSEWAAYVNSYTKLRKSTQSEINSIGYKDRTPVTLSLKDGGYIHLYPVIEKTEVTETVQGKLTVKIPYMDRYIIGYEPQNDSNMKYYTVLSISPLIRHPGKTKENMYQTCSINKVDSNGNISKEFAERGTDLLKDNDKMIISGVSGKNDFIDVYIKDGRDISESPNPIKDSPITEIYKIAHIASIEGEWSLEKTFSHNMKTSDGEQFTLGNKIYYSQIDHKDSSGRDIGVRRLADLTK